MSTRDTKTNDDGAISPDMMARDPVIGQLKEMYDNVVEEPLPDDLLHLLDKLDQAERAR